MRTPRLALVLVLAFVGAACRSSTGPSANPSTQTLSGTWTGTASQPGGPVANLFNYRLVLTESGATVSGTARVEVQSGTPRYFAEYSVSGTVGATGTVQIQENSITSQLTPPNIFWCIKALSLTRPSANRLVGTWSAPGCLPGEIDVSR